MKNLKQKSGFLLPPVITAAILLSVFWAEGLFPFGERTVAWCDMTQQVIPLLMDLKDILKGEAGFFFNINNAGGMNFFGVFFFFLSSPFSFLVAFVDKADMLLFANVLVILKLALSSLSAYIFFTLRPQKPSYTLRVLLSSMYALCGYGMLFYQNVMWLDICIAFPPLVLALEHLIERKTNIFYTVMLSVIMVLNFYIGVIVAAFVLLFMGINILSKEQDFKEISVKFISGTFFSVLITAVVWLPSLLGVSASARGESFVSTILNSRFLSHYETVLPLLFCSAFIFVCVGGRLISGKKRSGKLNRYLLLFFLTLVPFFIEPINIMWHTGSYMSFPARYGFITIFMGLICCAEILSEEEEGVINAPVIVTSVFSFFIAIFYGAWLINFVNLNLNSLSNYTMTLWGNSTSFDGLAKVFFIGLACYGAVYLLYRFKRITKTAFVILISALFIFESVANIKVYMVSPSVHNSSLNQHFEEIVSLEDKIEDNDFYRVMTSSKITDYNMVGAIGYPSLSHYTSLTDKSYMFTQKRLGYTSVWMEVGSQGGTEFTNALYSVKYMIKPDESGYEIDEQDYYYGLGIITDANLNGLEEIPEDLTRAEVQQYIFEALYGDKLITEYEFDDYSSGIQKSNGYYYISNGAYIRYTVNVKGKQSLYADLFSRLSNDLSEVYYSSLKITVNGRTLTDNYPRATNNGVYKLGEFENETVSVVIEGLKDVQCRSFGVFGLDLEKLSDKISETETANLKTRKNSIEGEYFAENKKTCLLQVPYNTGFTVKVNGKKVEYNRAFSNFITFPIEKGSNKVEIRFLPNGFVLGLIASLLGIALFALYIIFRKKIKTPQAAAEIGIYLFYMAVITGFIAVYVAPILIVMLKIFIK